MSEHRARTCILAALLWLATPPALAGEPAVKDPTEAPGLEAAASDSPAAKSMRLQSTRVSATSRSAVIDGRVVTPGSRINGATVISIEPGRVHLRRGSEHITLRMPSTSVKQPIAGDAS